MSDGVTASGITLDSLAAFAFGMEPWRLVVPDWFKEARYNVQTVHADPEGQPRIRGTGPPISLALRDALIEKFALVYHREKRSVDTWVMRLPVPAPDSMVPADARYATAAQISVGGTLTRLVCQPCRIPAVAEALARLFSTAVDDQTDLSGAFTFSVTWNTGDTDSLIRAWREATGIELAREFAQTEMLVVDGAIRPGVSAERPSQCLCEPSPAVRAAIEALPLMDDYTRSFAERIAPRRKLAQQFAGDTFAGMEWADALAARPGVADEWDRALESFSRLDNMPASDLLRARLLLPFQKALSKRLLEAIPESAPEAPWAQLGLAAWIRVHTPEDRAGLEHRVREFHRLCPGSTAVAGFVEDVRDPELVRELSDSLGRVLEITTDRAAIAAYPGYWSLLLRARPANPAPRIQKDVVRVRFLNRLGDAGWQNTLRRGYALLGDENAMRALDAAIVRHAGELGDAAAIRSWKSGAARSLKGADAYLDAIERHPDLDEGPLPAPLEVAAEYTRRSVHADRIGDLVDRGLAIAVQHEAHRRLSDVPSEARRAAAAIAAAYAEAKRILGTATAGAHP